MGKGIEIDFTAGTSDLIRSTENVADALDDVADSLDDITDAADDTARSVGRSFDRMADDARDAADDIGDAFKDVPKDAGDSVDKLEKKFSESWKAIKADAKEGADAISAAARTSATDSTDAVGEFKDEAKQNLAEVTSSFDGSVSSLVDLAQGTFGGLAANLGPAGMVGSALIAAGIGLANSLWQQSQEDAEELKAKIGEVTEEIIEAGGSFRNLEFQEKIREAAEETEDWERILDDTNSELEDWVRTAERAGIASTDFVLGMAGDLDAAARAQDDLTRKTEYYRAMVAATEKEGNSGYWVDLANGAQLASDALERASGVTGGAQTNVDLLNQVLAQTAPTIDFAAQATAKYSEDVASYLGGAGESWEKYVTDGKVNLDDYNANMEAHAQAVQGFEANMVTASATLSDEALAYIKSLGPEAAPLLQAYIDAPLAQQQRTAANWNTIGAAAVQGYSGSISGLTGATTGAAAAAEAATSPIKITATVNAANLQRDADNAAARIRSPQIGFTFKSYPAYP